MKKILMLILFAFLGKVMIAQSTMGAYTELELSFFTRTTLTETERTLPNRTVKPFRQTPWGSSFDVKIKKNRAKGKLLPLFHFDILSDQEKFLELQFSAGFYSELRDGFEISFTPIMTAGKFTEKVLSFGTITGLAWQNKEKTCLVSGKIGYAGIWRWQISSERYLCKRFQLGVLFDENRTAATFNLFFGKKNETQLSFEIGAQGYWGGSSKVQHNPEDPDFYQQFPVLEKSGTFGVNIVQKI